MSEATRRTAANEPAMNETKLMSEVNDVGYLPHHQ